MLIWFRTASFVDDKTAGGAVPLSRASFHLEAQRHHLSPGFKPGKPFKQRAEQPKNVSSDFRHY